MQLWKNGNLKDLHADGMSYLGLLRVCTSGALIVQLQVGEHDFEGLDRLDYHGVVPSTALDSFVGTQDKTKH